MISVAPKILFVQNMNLDFDLNLIFWNDWLKQFKLSLPSVVKNSSEMKHLYFLVKLLQVYPHIPQGSSYMQQPKMMNILGPAILFTVLLNYVI